MKFGYAIFKNGGKDCVSQVQYKNVDRNGLCHCLRQFVSTGQWSKTKYIKHINEIFTSSTQAQDNIGVKIETKKPIDFGSAIRQLDL